MWLYFAIFLVMLVLYSNSASKPKEQQDKMFKYCMIFLALFVGMADMLGGYDRYIYGECFDGCADAIRQGRSIWGTQLIEMYKLEFGYCLWNILVGYLTSNRYIFIFLTTALMYVLFYRAIKKQSANPMFALAVFMALTFYFSFTYLRQILAAAILWQSLPFIEKRDFKRFALWVIIAATFHNSAIIFFPVYFIPFKKFSKNLVDVVFIACLMIGLTGVTSNLFEAYADATDALARASASDFSVDAGFRWAYLLEAGFFYYYIRKYYDRLGEDKHSLVSLNLSIVFCCVLLLFLHSENGGRLSWFFMIGLYSMLSYIFSGTKQLAKPLLIVVVMFALYARILLLWGVLLSPYKTFWTPGHRDGDYIYQKYEYDHQYDMDKFYRL